MLKLYVQSFDGIEGKSETKYVAFSSFWLFAMQQQFLGISPTLLSALPCANVHLGIRETILKNISNHFDAYNSMSSALKVSLTQLVAWKCQAVV